MNSTQTPAATQDLGSQRRRRDAFQQLLPAMTALKPEELASVNRDIPSVIATILGRIDKIRTLREQAATLQLFDLAHIDQLEGSVVALAFAHSEWLLTTTRFDRLQKLNAEAIELRDLLWGDLSQLVRRKLVDSKNLASYTGKTGYKIVATELMTLASALSNNWGPIQGKCGVEESEIDRAEALGMSMLRLVGDRGDALKAKKQAADTRLHARSASL